jgi:DUF4097 and DUF4098 domain-containing protein YvlB
MLTRSRIARCLTITALLAAAASSAQAQRFRSQSNTDDAWLDRCERDSDRDDRVAVCEVRVSGFRPSRSGFRFDPGANGGVSLEGWDRDSVAVHARIRAHAENTANARALARDVQIGRSGNTVSAEAPETGRRESVSVELVVYLPRRSDVTAETVNGPISARNLFGTLDLQTANGPLSLEAVGGDVQARTTNGPLSIRLTGLRWEGTGLDAETSNGPATLYIPEDYSAELETGTRNGPFDADFPLTVTLTGRMQRHFTTTLGRGGTPIRVVTSNGPLSLRRS